MGVYVDYNNSTHLPIDVNEFSAVGEIINPEMAHYWSTFVIINEFFLPAILSRFPGKCNIHATFVHFNRKI